MDCQCYVGRAKTSVHWGFFPLNSQLAHSLNPLPFRSDPLRRGSENAGKESFPSSCKDALARATPGWDPKAEGATSWPTLRLQRWQSMEIPPAISNPHRQYLATWPGVLPVSGPTACPPYGLSFLFSANKTSLTFATRVHHWLPPNHETTDPHHLSILAHQGCKFKGKKRRNEGKIEAV
jgi:hypothetical protein